MARSLLSPFPAHTVASAGWRQIALKDITVIPMIANVNQEFRISLRG
jgi:hypothetical protein